MKITTKYFLPSEDFGAFIRENMADIVAVKQIPTGWTNHVFISTDEHGGKFIYRFPRNDFFADCIVPEYGFTKFIRENLSFRTTDMELFYRDGRAFSRHTFIEGHTMTEFMVTANEAQRAAFARDAVAMIKELQGLDGGGIVTEMASEFLGRLSRVNGKGYPEDMVKGLVKLEADSVLAHGDLNAGNILVDDDGRIVAVLDWAFLTHSARLHDLARLIGRMPPEFKLPLMREYTQQIDNVDDCKLDFLIELWAMVDGDYVEYMLREHPEIDLSAITNASKRA